MEENLYTAPENKENHQSLLKPVFTVLCETQHTSVCSLPTSR